MILETTLNSTLSLKVLYKHKFSQIICLFNSCISTNIITNLWSTNFFTKIKNVQSVRTELRSQWMVRFLMTIRQKFAMIKK